MTLKAKMSLTGKALKVKFNFLTEMKLTVGSDAIFLFSHMNSRTAMKQETIIPPVKTMKTPPRFGRPSCALLPPSPPYDNFWEKEKKAGFREYFFHSVFCQNHCPQKICKSQNNAFVAKNS